MGLADSTEEQQRTEIEILKKQLEDIRLELSTPETTECANKKEPLYKWAALIVCENHRLRIINTRLLSTLNFECPEKYPDNCEVCEGTNAGVKGNENIIDGVVMCDYCHAATMVKGGD